ncbi:FAD-binding oxidoreductase [Cupriavidus sp. AU9028]|uniref:NAD(P)/FAD-dependent oxidoreductase n=1 Tax=Cupriavidus sp. AU9028 TaxID=2871157 RepID=UPI001C96C0B0|nr:FAD-dependent oxidoreductase [Cupriavidus sp. AU9028]MBY4896449.1 FAD-binding oxidoreductase [Cupriavidus sp. AU9028]
MEHDVQDNQHSQDGQDDQHGIADFAIIGAGIAGASLGYRLAGRAKTVMLEREAQPGYHSTGRSAAMFMETYGTAAIRALTRAGRAFYANPPAGFLPDGEQAPLLTPRGVLYVARPDQLELLDAAYDEARARSPEVERVGLDAMLALAPCLRADVVAAGMTEPDACDIDVHALHQGFLRGFRRQGGTLVTDAQVQSLRYHGDRWEIGLADGRSLLARAIVNAAGAWADVLAALADVPPVGLQPCRRSAFTFPAPAGVDISAWPAVVGIDESFYFKPDAGQLLGSPANADPMPPHDVVAEEIDIATGIWHIEQTTTLRIPRPSHTWAGLRSFVPDGDPVIGWDNHRPAFFWLAGQGGYGIQSAAGASSLAASLLLDDPLESRLVAEGVDPLALGPQRLR